MKTVLVAGYFDPLHDGHLDHILKAARLGDFLYIVTHTDGCTEQVKEMRYTTVMFRHFILTAILKEIGVPGSVIVTEQPTVASVIRQFKPNIFAKGGDRTASNMPESELQACREAHCEIVYGVGEKINSSSDIKANIRRQHADSSR